MTIAKMIKQIKILEIIIICILVKTLYGKSLNKIQDRESEQKNERIKRGYSHYGGNDFGSSVHVSSGVLQYSGDDEHSINLGGDLNIQHDGGLDLADLSEDHTSVSHYEPAAASNADHWSASGLSPGYEVWLEPTANYHGSSTLESSIHAGSDHIVNSVFSDESTQSANFHLPSSQLHTKISSSSSSSIAGNIHDHGTLAISDNVDFNNVADIKTKHYTKSYGK